MKKIYIYLGLFAVLLTGFYFALFRDYDFTKSPLGIVNDKVQDFAFITQNGDTLTQRDVEQKVHVVEYFFTTCKGICPQMNANMRRVFEIYKNEPDFAILSHTCMPEVDSIALLKKYERNMLLGKLVQKRDGSYTVNNAVDTMSTLPKTNWYFLTGAKDALYKMARESYAIDNNKPDSTQEIADQFIHTQFFALLDKERRVRGVYDGLKEDEVTKLIKDIKALLKERITSKRFMNGFSNTPE